MVIRYRWWNRVFTLLVPISRRWWDVDRVDPRTNMIEPGYVCKWWKFQFRIRPWRQLAEGADRWECDSYTYLGERSGVCRGSLHKRWPWWVPAMSFQQVR